jgi:hypothetical protein
MISFQSGLCHLRHCCRLFVCPCELSVCGIWKCRLQNNIKVYVLLHKYPSDTSEMIEMHSVRWYWRKHRFVSSINVYMIAVQVSVTIHDVDDSTLTDNKNIKHVFDVVRSDWWKSMQEISMQVEISVGSVYSTRHKDLNIRYITFVQKC